MVAGLWDTLGRIGQIPARSKAGEFYQRGYDDAREGRGKSSDVINMKASADASSITPELAKVSFIMTDAYDEGYRDGMARAEMELRTKKNIRF